MLSQIRPMSIRSTREDEIRVIAVDGPLGAGGGDLLFRAAIADALAAGEKRLVVDFAQLTTLDSSGLGELVRAADAVTESGARMIWSSCPKTMLDLLAITRVRFEHVAFREGLEEAVAAFA